MNKVSAQLFRWSYVLILAFLAGLLATRAARHTGWYRDHLYRCLIDANPETRFNAAVELATLGAQEQLLRGLRHDSTGVNQLARRGLEHIWFTQAGDEACQLATSAHAAIKTNDLEQALSICNRLTEKFPEFAEGWNRRASVQWELGNFEKSMADCERALALNPNHFGAWQGMGACQLQLGQVVEACRSLRTAKKICPHDDATRRALEKCEELLRQFTPRRQSEKPWSTA